MNYRKIEIQGNVFIELEVQPVFQQGNTFYVGKLLADYLLHMYTVRPAKYDFRINSELANEFQDEADYYNHLITQNQSELNKKDFQRNYDTTRANNIANFLDTKEQPFFPNTIIANCDLINDIEEFSIDKDSTVDEFVNRRQKLSHLTFLNQQGGKTFLYIPFQNESILIIDGQHRLEGLKRSSESTKNNYEVLLSFIVGYDRSVIAKQFYTINYEQKSVNKSLLYQLTGEFSTDIDELSFLHNVVKVLNEFDGSPFEHRIKMLGVIPPNIEEGKYLFSLSQAFLIDSLMKTILGKASNSIYQPIFRVYFESKDRQIYIIKFLIKFFNSIKSLVIGWEDPTSSIASKGMGVGAFIRLLNFVYIKLFIVHYNFDSDFINSISVGEIKQCLSGIEKVDLGVSGKYGGVGSAGNINKIKEDLVENASLFEGSNYKDVVDTFKTDLLPRYRSWFDKTIN